MLVLLIIIIIIIIVRLGNTGQPKMDWWVIMLIVVGGLFGLYILYKVVGYILRFMRWVWKRCCKPPIDACYNNCMTPIGHCCRDTIFTCKEGICDLEDRCDTCFNPYKRI